MKISNLQISFDEAKLSALKRYMSKKDLSLEAEMSDALAKLYEKHVPAPVREYIEECATQEDVPKRKYQRRAEPHGEVPASEVAE